MERSKNMETETDDVSPEEKWVHVCPRRSYCLHDKLYEESDDDDGLELSEMYDIDAPAISRPSLVDAVREKQDKKGKPRKGKGQKSDGAIVVSDSPMNFQDSQNGDAESLHMDWDEEGHDGSVADSNVTMIIDKYTFGRTLSCH